jgi:hypothetical protein
MVVLGQSTRKLEYLRNSQTRSKPSRVSCTSLAALEKRVTIRSWISNVFFYSLFFGSFEFTLVYPARSFAAAAAADARYVVRGCVLLTSMCSRVDPSSDCAQFSNAENQSSAEIIAKKNVFD